MNCAQIKGWENTYQGLRKHVKVDTAKWETMSTAGGSYKRQGREHLRGVRGHASPENFENVASLKPDLQHFLTKSIIFLLQNRLIV